MINRILVDFPINDDLYIDRLILSTIPSTKGKHRIGYIHDNSKCKLSLENGSNINLTITLKNGDQKIVNRESFFEYQNVKVIKISDGTSCNYLTSFGQIICGECSFDISQHD